MMLARSIYCMIENRKIKGMKKYAYCDWDYRNYFFLALAFLFSSDRKNTLEVCLFTISNSTYIRIYFIKNTYQDQCHR